MQIKGTMIMGDLLDQHPECADILRAAGMPCLGCPAARAESIAQACAAHSVNLLALLDKLNAFVQEKEK